MNDNGKLVPVPKEILEPVTSSESDQVIDSVISARHLTKKFRDETAVKDVSFEVPRGSIFGFIGPSGSGKTTTVRLLTGVYIPTEGEVIVFDRNPAKLTRRERVSLGYMPQLFVLYTNLTVWENINFAASLYGMSLFRRKRLWGDVASSQLGVYPGSRPAIALPGRADRWNRSCFETQVLGSFPGT
jgi:ABC-type sugar transport system ATPase subunit